MLKKFKKGDINILICTQVGLKKTLLPKVEFATVMTFDIILNLPDFRTGERIMYIADILGTISATPILIQTYITDNYLMQLFNRDISKKTLMSEFLKQELHNRRQLSFPPYSQLIKLDFYHKDLNVVIANAELAKNKLTTQLLHLGIPEDKFMIMGPSPAFIPRVNNRYIYQIMIKSKLDDIQIRNKVLNVAAGNCRIDVDPI